MDLSNLIDIEEVEPLSERDRDILSDVRAVLERHDAVHRFGVTLLHKHFAVADDEILVETVDKGARTLTARPVSVAEATRLGTPIETSWRLDSADGQLACLAYCFRAPGGQFHMK